MCCILTIDRAVNQRFSAQDAPVEISVSSDVGWMEMCECYEMIYAGTHVRYGQSQSWISLNLRPEEIRSVTESTSEWLGTPQRQWPTAGLRLSTSRPRSRKSAMWNLTLRGMVKRRSYGSYGSLSSSPSLRLSLSHHRSFDSKKE